MPSHFCGVLLYERLGAEALARQAGLHVQMSTGGSGHTFAFLGDRRAVMPMHGGSEELDAQDQEGPGTKMSLAYQLILESDADTIRVECPRLPEVNTFGMTEGDALHHAVDAAETVLAQYIGHDENIPEADVSPSDRWRLQLPFLSSLKIDLYKACRASGATRAELARRLGWRREQVDRLFRLNPASRLERLGAAFRALGCVIDLQVRAAA